MVREVFASLTLVLISLCLGNSPLHAQSNPLPLGHVIDNPTLPPTTYSCANALNGNLFLPGMTCQNKMITCPNTQNIGITYGWSLPSGTNRGTIVMFSGGSGISPTEYADESLAYGVSYQTNYVVVQVEYDSPWQDPSNASGGNILNAACRPATFLSWVNSNANLHSGGTAMCAQGSSAGGAGIAYSLAWYGAYSYLKNVELLSGPTLSEIDQGCVTPPPPDQTICGTVSGVKQYGCTPATNAWTNSPKYVSGYLNFITNWSGLNGCTQSSGQANLPAWQQMSIVDGSVGAARPVFSYGNGLRVHGWVCASYATGQCSAPHCPNNSASQGNYLYQQFSSTQTPNSHLTGMLQCVQEEGVRQGVDPDTNLSGQNAITQDMTNSCQ